jgi:hypothetical protein
MCESRRSAESVPNLKTSMLWPYFSRQNDSALCLQRRLISWSYNPLYIGGNLLKSRRNDWYAETSASIVRSYGRLREWLPFVKFKISNLAYLKACNLWAKPFLMFILGVWDVEKATPPFPSLSRSIFALWALQCYLQRLLPSSDSCLKGGAYGRGWISILITQWLITHIACRERQEDYHYQWTLNSKTEFTISFSGQVQWILLLTFLKGGHKTKHTKPTSC